jgi:hypothetical protein
MSDVPTWDFQTALWDTIRERYESLYVHVVAVSNLIHRRRMRTCEQQKKTNWIKEGF